MKTRHPGETGTYFHHLTDGQRNIYTNTGGTHRHGSVNTLGEYLARNAGFTECLGESTQGWQQPSCQGKYIFLHKFLIFIKFGCKVTQKAPNWQEFGAFYLLDNYFFTIHDIDSLREVIQ